MPVLVDLTVALVFIGQTIMATHPRAGFQLQLSTKLLYNKHASTRLDIAGTMLTFSQLTHNSST